MLILCLFSCIKQYKKKQRKFNITQYGVNFYQVSYLDKM